MNVCAFGVGSQQKCKSAEALNGKGEENDDIWFLTKKIQF